LPDSLDQELAGNVDGEIAREVDEVNPSLHARRLGSGRQGRAHQGESRVFSHCLHSGKLGSDLVNLLRRAIGFDLGIDLDVHLSESQVELRIKLSVVAVSLLDQIFDTDIRKALKGLVPSEGSYSEGYTGRITTHSDAKSDERSRQL
jgi:hypothetical protein